MDRWRDRCKDGWIEGRTRGWMDGRMDKASYRDASSHLKRATKDRKEEKSASWVNKKAINVSNTQKTQKSGQKKEKKKKKTGD